MSTVNKESKILWAVDAFSENPTAQFNALKAAMKLYGKSNPVVEPVSVLSPDQLKVPRTAFRSGSKEYRLEAEKILEKWTKKLKIKNTVPPVLLLQDEFSLRTSVKTLIDYAKQTHADVICTTTRANKGLKHFILGSFTESLLTYSTVPVFVFNPKTQVPANYSKIFFPTDFGTASRTALDKLLPIAKQNKSTIILFYKLEYVLPETSSTLFGAPIYANYVEQDIQERKDTANKWMQSIKQQGVKAELLFNEKPDYVVTAILKAFKKSKASLIAMASHSGAIETALLGSVTRQVVRSATCPVWVIHS